MAASPVPPARSLSRLRERVGVRVSVTRPHGEMRVRLAFPGKAMAWAMRIPRKCESDPHFMDPAASSPPGRSSGRSPPRS